MQTITTFDELSKILGGRRSCVTVGVFDGVHLGHQALVSTAVELAKQHDQVPVALTFKNHPLSTLAPPYTPRRLLTPQRKANLLHNLGIEIVVMLDFTAKFAAMTPQNFARECLVKKANTANIVCGYDFTFGCQGTGNLQLLQQIGSESGFHVCTINAVSQENHPVKSTHIRDLLSGGNVRESAKLLTRPHEVPGLIGSGMQRGRTIGYPTANLDIPDNYQIPAGGVYVCGARIAMDTKPLSAMVNIGTSPTFGSNAQTLEAHIIDFSGDIHGKPLSLFFIDRLRDEQKFPSIASLVEQLHQDQEQTRRLWSSNALAQVVASIPGPVDHQLN